MPADRIDHFVHMRAEPGPATEPPEGAPIVSPMLVEWLEKAFPVFVASPPGTLDQAVYALSSTNRSYGEQSVLAYLRTLVRAA